MLAVLVFGAGSPKASKTILMAQGPALPQDAGRRMEPYASPKEKKIGAKRPKIQHVAPDPARSRSRSERVAEKQAVAAERRAIKKSARRHLKQQMLSEVDDGG